MDLADLPFRGDENEEHGVKSKWPRGYTGWGPYEDVMGDDGNWTGPTIKTAEDWLADRSPSYLNIVIDFYFAVEHDHEKCKACGGTGQNPETDQIENDFYDFSHTGRRWCDNITQDEVQALVDRGRLRNISPATGKWEAPNPVPTAEEINAQNRPGAKEHDHDHDAINRWILVETRAKRLGVWGKCSTCAGTGETRLSEDYYSMYLWLTHPRKGAARGVHLKHVRDEHLPKLKEMLRESWSLLQQHFAWALDKPEWVAKEEDE